MKRMSVLLILFCAQSLFAQLPQLRLEGKPEKVEEGLVVRQDVNGRYCAAIRVQTNVEGLRYEANMGIAGNIERKAGMDIVYLSPDERVLEILHTQYKSMKIILSDAGIRLNPQDVWQITVTGEARTITVTIVVEPADAIIKLDGKDIGKGPGFKLPVGKHTLALEHPEYEPLEEQIDISEDRAYFKFPMKKRESTILVVNSDPSGADLYLDGQLVGVTPYEGVALSGRYQLEARKNLYLPVKKEVFIRGGETQRENLRLKPNFGFLKITSQPEGAQVFIGDRPMGQTPYTSPEMDKGQYSLKLSKSLYYSEEKQVAVEIDTTISYHVILKEAFGGISLLSRPEGAEVLINGQLKGKTPYRDGQLPSGSYQLSLRRELYREVSKRITVADGKLYEESIDLPPNFGIISIKTAPDARVFVDGKIITNIGQSMTLVAGAHILEAQKDKHNPAKLTLNVQVGDNRTIDLFPEARSGSLALLVNTKGAKDARITINGKDYGSAPKIIKDLLEGSHSLELRKDGYLPLRRMFDVEYQKEQTLKLDMVTYAGSQQAKRDSWNRRRNWTLLGTAVCAAASGYLKYEADKAFDNYEKVVTVSKATFYRNKTDDYDGYTQIGLGATGVLGLWTMYNQIRKSMVQVPKDKISLDYDTEQQRVMVSVRF